MLSMARDQQPKPVRYTVHFLDNSEETFEVDKKDKAQVLLDKAFQHLELNERDFFGLQFADVAQCDEEPTSASGCMRWIDPAKSLKKQMKFSPPYTLHFRVKFYVPDPRCLKEEYTRYQFFLQLTKDLAEGRLTAPYKTVVQLASYAVQSELGDYNPEEHGPDYLSEFHFAPNQTDDVLKEIEELHKKNRGMSPATCEILYIDTAKSLDGYGIDLFKATLDAINEEIQLGVTSLGLVVFQNGIKINTFCWSKIVKISFKRKQFFIHLRKESDETVENLFGFNMASYRSCKNLWKSCVEHHTFFCLHTLHPRNEPIEEIPMAPQFQITSSTDKSQSLSNRQTFTRSSSEKLYQSKDVFDDVLMSSWNDKLMINSGAFNLSYCDRRTFENSQLKLTHNSALKSNCVPSLDCLNADMTTKATVKHTGLVNGQHLSPSPMHASAVPEVQNMVQHTNNQSRSESRNYRSLDRRTMEHRSAKKLLEAVDSKVNCHSEPTSDDESRFQQQQSNDGNPSVMQPSGANAVKFYPISGNGQHSDFASYSDLALSSNSRLSAQDCQGLVVIRMKPDEHGRFGFNVKGGSDQLSPIIVSRVAQGTPADCCFPRLMEGDQVLFINGRDVSQHTHAQVVQFIKASREIHSGELVLVVRPNAYIGEDNLSQPDLQYIPDTHHIIAVLPPGGDPLAGSMTLLRESVESSVAVAQFEQIYRKKPGYTMNVSQLPENVSKNRYRDIAPYDQTRVRLKGTTEDYINANIINMEIAGSGIVNRYIAAQGPLPETSTHFWLMIWEQHSSLVVMLTTVVEQGRVKCHQYWPDLHQTTQFGKLSVTCITEDITRSFAFRDFTLTHSEFASETHHVYQMQYLAWPDHGVPDDCTDFLNFIIKVRQRRAGCVEPTVVHCSAGIGRTGVLIAMETAMCMIESRQPVYLLEIVRQMRDQRAMLIQTPEQYKFVCEAVLKVFDDHVVEPLDDYNR